MVASLLNSKDYINSSGISINSIVIRGKTQRLTTIPAKKYSTTKHIVANMYFKLTILLVFVLVFCLTHGGVMRRKQQNYDAEERISNQATNCSGYNDSCDDDQDCCTEPRFQCITVWPGTKVCLGGGNPEIPVQCHQKPGCALFDDKCNNTSDCCCEMVCVGGEENRACVYNRNSHAGSLSTQF